MEEKAGNDVAWLDLSPLDATEIHTPLQLHVAESSADESSNDSLSTPKEPQSDDAALGSSEEPPLYTIDLNLPPRQRYVALAKDMRDQIKVLADLFAQLIHDIHPKLPIKPFIIAAKLLLRRLYSKEETDEIRGIAKAAGVSMFLLVALNLLLDTFMGCSSGGVRVRDRDDPKSTRMLHYRTLDWGMEPLRKSVVRLRYVRSPDPTVIAQNVTYAGFVGILTGVMPNLSLSLNFRAEHDSSTSEKNKQYYWHVLLVLLGRRPSISSVLRSCIFRPSRPDLYMPQFRDGKSNLDIVVDALQQTQTCSAYVIFSDGQETRVLEKDFDSANIISSESFLAATNTDVKYDSEDVTKVRSSNNIQGSRGLQDKAEMQMLIEESVDRKLCMAEKWKDACAEHKLRHPESTDEDVSVDEEDVVSWVNDFPVSNEATQFACVMDPKRGDMYWCRRRLEMAHPPKHMVAAMAAAKFTANLYCGFSEGVGSSDEVETLEEEMREVSILLMMEPFHDSVDSWRYEVALAKVVSQALLRSAKIALRSAASEALTSLAIKCSCVSETGFEDISL
ncbi:MAG: hypothetical protein Q9159_002196 [Coniocarpon cinnabarinum]